MAATKRKIDLRNVKESGNFRPRRVEEGEYVGRITNVDDHTSKTGGEGWVFTFMIEGDARSSYPIYVQSDEKNAWKVRKLMLATGLKAPKSLIMFDPNKLVGRAMGAYMEDDEYEGREKSSVSDFLPVDEVSNGSDVDDTEEEPDDEPIEDDEEVEEDEPEPTPPPRKKRRPTPQPEPEDDDEEELDEEPPPPPVRKRRPAPAPVVEDEDDLDDEEEEEPAPPPRRTRPAKRAAPRKATPPPVDDEDDDLDLDDL